MRRWLAAAWLGIAVLLAFSQSAAGNQWKIQEEETEDYLGELMEEEDFSELDAWVDLLPEGDGKLTFSDLVSELAEQGFAKFDYSLILKWGADSLFSELEGNKTLLVEVVLLVMGFSVLRNFSGAFRSAYISELCFMLVYCVLAVMLLQSFLAFRDIVTEALNSSVNFMQALVPALCIAMVFSSGAGASAGFYQMAFLVIYLIQWLFLKFLVPCIHMYVILELFNHFFEDEKFQNLAELINGLICWGLKISGAVVLGLNVVQSLIAPARDRFVNGTVSKAASAIPGIGNSIDGVSELLLGSGLLIKNSVGAAALIFLVISGLIPIAKVLCMAVMYKLAAVVTEPVADKRIAGCLKGMAEGGMLYVKLLIYCIVLFFLTIALTTAASSFIY
ncbi:MAG: stage III sporulation protein AE [Roseburia sp.]|nr:stage III sporulation protein AE [Roseburia sp.]